MMKKNLGAKTILGVTPVLLVGSYDPEQRPNIMTVAWGGICCSRPPCLTISLRKATYTYGNIMARQAFTVSVPSAEQVREADLAGIISGRDRDKFAACGFTPAPSDKVDAPYVAECDLILECRLIHTHEIGLHTQFIGEILDVLAEERVLDPEGNLDTALLGAMIYAPGDRRYFATGTLLGKAFSLGKELEQA